MYKFERMDVAESAFFSRQLEFIRTKTYDFKYPELKGRMLCPVDNEISTGAEVFTFRQYDWRGTAKIISNYADDLPRADVVGHETSVVIKPLGASYGYSLQEARNGMLTGTPLSIKKASAARLALEQLLDLIAQTGNSEHGLFGLLNQPNATIYTIPNGVGGSPLWVNKTAAEILADMNGIVSNQVSITKEIEAPNTMVLPIEQFELIDTLRIGDGSSDTIMAHFLAKNRHIKEIVSWYACDGAGVGATDRMLVYKKDMDCLSLIVPQEFEQLPPEYRNLEVLTNCHMRTAGVVVYYPLGFSYGDGI